MELTNTLRKKIITAQRNEITEYHIYKRIAAFLPAGSNRDVVEKIASDELGHYQKWKHFTGQDVKPRWFYIFFYSMVSRCLDSLSG